MHHLHPLPKKRIVRLHVDFSHFNLSLYTLSRDAMLGLRGGSEAGACWGCIERPSYIHIYLLRLSSLPPPRLFPPVRFSCPPAHHPLLFSPLSLSFPLFPPTFVAFHPFYCRPLIQPSLLRGAALAPIAPRRGGNAPPACTDSLARDLCTTYTIYGVLSLSASDVSHEMRSFIFYFFIKI